MAAQYAHLDGRRYVNEDFVHAARQAFPATTKKIPLGFSVYTGSTGKDEVLFVRQGATVPDVGFDGLVYQVSFDPSHPECFEDHILKQVKHSTLKGKKAAGSTPARRRLAAADDLERLWSTTLTEHMARRVAATEHAPKTAATQHAAARGQGLYGFPKSIQAACVSATRRLNQRASSLVRRAMKKDDGVVGFLNTHAKRGESLSAKVLLGAYRDALPQIELDALRLDPPENPETMILASTHVAKTKYGAYGYPAKTASLGLAACSALREYAGELAADLHTRRASLHPRITGFLGEHGKTARCGASRLLLSCYPEAGFCRSAAAADDDWLVWDGP